MNTTGLIQNLKSFNSKRLKEFDKFVNSSYFIKRSQIPALYNKLKNYYPEYRISKQQLFRETFSGKTYNNVLMKKYISELNRMLDKYLAINMFENDRYVFYSMLAREKTNTFNFRDLKKVCNTMQKELNFAKIKDEGYYQYKYVFDAYTDLSNNLNVSTYPINYSEQTINSFIEYSAVSALRNFLFFLNNRRYTKYKHGYKILGEMVNQYYEHGKIINPLSMLYYNMISLQLNPKMTESYYTIKELLFKHEKELSGNDVHSFYVFLHNFCYEKADTGDMEFVKERYEILKLFIDKGYSFENGRLNPIAFSSMILNILLLSKVNEAVSFYELYKEFLPRANRSSLLNFCMANIYLHKKEYSKALELMGKIRYNDIFDNIRTRTLYIMIYFENRQFDAVLYQVESFRKFISNNKLITSFMFERCLNFLKQVVKLVNYINGKPVSVKLAGFDKKPLMNRPWLNKMIKEIEIKKAG